MTSAMFDAAENRRWTEVQRIDEARAKLLHGLPPEAFTSGDPGIRGMLGEALEATSLIERRLIDARDELGHQLKQRNQRQHAAEAYRSAG
jgi:hypothetical protein